MITINSGEFSRICRELYSLSDSLGIITETDQVKLAIDGAAGVGYIKLTANDDCEKKEDATTIQVEQPVSQQFALSYLNMFNKASTLSVFTRVLLHQEQPLVVEFAIDSLGVLKYYLAPKVNEA